MLSLWSQRTSTEKGLIVALFSVSFTVIFAALSLLVVLLRPMAPLCTSVAYVLHTSAKLTKEYDLSVCSTPDCIHTASKLLQNLDENVDPCDNFYDFACGSFAENTMILDDREVVETISITQDELNEQVRSLLEEPITSNEPRPFSLAKTVYQGCMNTTAIEARGHQPLLDLLGNLGGWPVLDGDRWNDSNFSWKDSLHRFRKLGLSIDYFLELSVHLDLNNNSIRLINLNQGRLGLNREYLINNFSDKQVIAYYNFMVDIATLLGADKIRAEGDLKQSLQFEITLANISLLTEKMLNTTRPYNAMTIAQLTNKIPSIPWLDYINHMIAPHVTVGPEEIITFKSFKYIFDLEELLNVTSKRIQANYVMWRVAEAYASDLTESLRHRQFDFVAAVSGQITRKSRWKNCLETTSEIMYIAVGALYIRKFFNKNSKAMVVEMVNDIREQFCKILNEMDWIDDKTRNEALEKADSMTFHIAYPQELLDDNKLTEYYCELEISSDKWLESRLNLSLFAIESTFRQLREPVNKSDWSSHSKPVMVNVFYSPEDNSVQVPAGILQGTFFSHKRPAYMNYGSIGNIIGQAITHSFDNKRHQFDKNGYLVDWWQECSNQLYLKKTRCINAQYSKYTITENGLKLNGINTLRANIADYGGVKAAYYAYHAWTKRHGNESRLPGFEKYTPVQLFWLSLANVWCSVYRKEGLKFFLTTETHSQNIFRVIAPLSNMEEFARDYKCPVGSRMNPGHKWKVC